MSDNFSTCQIGIVLLMVTSTTHIFMFKSNQPILPFSGFSFISLCTSVVMKQEQQHTHFTSLSLDTALCGGWRVTQQVYDHQAQLIILQLYLLFLLCWDVYHFQTFFLLTLEPTCFSQFKTTLKNGQKCQEFDFGSFSNNCLCTSFFPDVSNDATKIGKTSVLRHWSVSKMLVFSSVQTSAIGSLSQRNYKVSSAFYSIQNLVVPVD